MSYILKDATNSKFWNGSAFSSTEYSDAALYTGWITVCNAFDRANKLQTSNLIQVIQDYGLDSEDVLLDNADEVEAD